MGPIVTFGLMAPWAQQIFDAANQPKEGFWPVGLGHNRIFTNGGFEVACGLSIRISASDQRNDLAFPRRKAIDARVIADVLVYVEEERCHLARDGTPTLQRLVDEVG